MTRTLLALALALSGMSGAQSFGVYGTAVPLGLGLQVQNAPSTAGAYRLGAAYQRGGVNVSAERLSGLGPDVLAGRAYWGAGLSLGYHGGNDAGLSGGVQALVGAEWPLGTLNVYGELGGQLFAMQTRYSDIGVVGGVLPAVRVGVRF